MKIKLSHSGKNTFLNCAKSYEYRYIKKLVHRQKGSALAFGVAIDTALNYMLENKDKPNVLMESQIKFDEKWTTQSDNKYDEVLIARNEDISYFKGDFDYELLNGFDKLDLPENLLKIRENVEYRKKDIGWYNLELYEREIYNYSSWLSLKNKGSLFIEAYYNQILPKIKRTVSVQMEIAMVDEINDAHITGFIDAVVELHDGRIVVLDNKTSSINYGDDSVKTSEQLALYKTILNMYAEDPNNSWKTKIDGAAYAVLSKKLNKITHKTCPKCGHKTTSSHAKCNNGKGKNRCNSEWDKNYEFTVNTQFIVDNIDQMLEYKVLNEIDDIVQSIKTGVFEHNFDSCSGKYGMACPYIHLCHEGSMVNLIDISEKKKNV